MNSEWMFQNGHIFHFVTSVFTAVVIVICSVVMVCK